MIGSVLIAMLNPMLATLFASIFLLLWHLRGGHAYIAEFALGYYAYAAAFLLQAIQGPFGDPTNALLANLLLTTAFFLIIHGILARLGRPAPLGALAVLALCGFAGLLWFIFVLPDMSGRIFSVNFMYGGMLLVAAAELRGIPGKARIDRALFAMLLLTGLYCFVRTLTLSILEGHIVDRAHYANSLMAIILNFSSAFFSLLIALTLIGAVIMDVMEELRAVSLTDPLSGLLNRRGLEDQAAKIISRLAGANIPAALVICDLDHFKAVNDRFGHACGDNVIAAFAACLRELTRDGAAARLGGEEFAVLLPAADLNAGRLFAEAARTACAGIVAKGLPAGHPVTASFGVAEMQPGEDLAALLKRADIALLDAKRSGRDRVRAYAAAPLRREVPAGERRRNRATLTPS